ncbi:MAG TPA: ATP-binding protein [Oligoflexus sp.]|uniref:ATP-binding protein n=1 Tax=Oligoflexus sp. TaxID=1971216 RepID=UPI002D7ECA8C|nr:ATP-binding protein [Oligoflexus sp.]HET9240851.1 ATP-binding protein [Oligoflexus sp.]
MKSIWRRNIEQDIDEGRFVSHFFLILLTLAVSALRGERQGPGFLGTFRLFFVKDADFRDGLIRFAHLCLFLLPIFALFFYLGIAFHARDPWLTFNISWCSAVMMGLAIHYSRVESRQDYSTRLRGCLHLALATIMTVFVIGCTSKESFDAHIEIWLYMVLTGFTIVLTFRMGLMLAILSAPMPLLFMMIHYGSADFGGFMELFGLISTYLLGSLLKWVSDSYAFQSRKNEDLARRRQKEIQFLLDTIPQGLLMIDESGCILPNYSDHTRGILEQESIVGQSLYDVLLKPCSMHADKKDQAWQAVQAILGQTVLSFELNEDSLPREVSFKEKFLSITWTPKLNDQGLCFGLLITILDVSQEKKNERMLNIQKQRITIIEELLAIQSEHKVQRNLERCIASLAGIHGSLDESRDVQAIHKDHKLTLHTIKGEARTLGLRELSSSVHLAEGFLFELSPGYSKQIEECLALAREYLNCWQRFHRHMSTIVLLYGGQKILLTSDELVTAMGDREVQSTSCVTQLFQSKLRQVNRCSLVKFLDSYRVSAANIAKRLGKLAPRIEIEGPSLLISQDTEIILDQILSHILANQIDHGIEVGEERVRKGKSDQGVITFRIAAHRSRLVLDIQDDGRGLDLAKLRSLGMEKKVLDSDASAEDVAELIFRGGFSTAQTVTETSGRGVGMEAVRDILSRHEGTIWVRLMGRVDADLRDFSFHIEIPDSALNEEEETLRLPPLSHAS